MNTSLTDCISQYENWFSISCSWNNTVATWNPDKHLHIYTVSCKEIKTDNTLVGILSNWLTWTLYHSVLSTFNIVLNYIWRPKSLSKLDLWNGFAKYQQYSVVHYCPESSKPTHTYTHTHIYTHIHTHTLVLMRSVTITRNIWSLTCLVRNMCNINYNV